MPLRFFDYKSIYKYTNIIITYNVVYLNIINLKFTKIVLYGIMMYNIVEFYIYISNQTNNDLNRIIM